MVQLLPSAAHVFADHGSGSSSSLYQGHGLQSHHAGGHRGGQDFRGSSIYGSRPLGSSHHGLEQFRSRPQTIGGGAGPHSAPEMFDVPFCPKHAPENRENQGWAEKENGTLLPMVNIGLATMGANLKTIIKVGGGSFIVSCLLLHWNSCSVFYF